MIKNDHSDGGQRDSSVRHDLTPGGHFSHRQLLFLSCLALTVFRGRKNCAQGFWVVGGGQFFIFDNYSFQPSNAFPHVVEESIPFFPSSL